MRTYFVDKLRRFCDYKDFRYLGMALHPIYDIYDEDMYKSCAASTPGSGILFQWDEWFFYSAVRDKDRPVGYSLVGRRNTAIRFVYNEVMKSTMFFLPDAERLYNRWITNLLENEITYAPCIDPGYYY